MMACPSNTCNSYAFRIALLSSMGGFLFGYDTGVVSGAMIQLRQKFAFSDLYEELFVSITILSAAIFALTSGYLNDKFGRKSVIMLSSVLYLMGSLSIACSLEIPSLMIGRSIVGIAVGLSSMSIPIYIAECSPCAMRSTLVTMNISCIVGGQLIAAIIDGLFYADHKNGWRYMFGLAAVPAVVQLVGFVWLPESPRWLVMRGQTERARAVLTTIYHKHSSLSNEESDEDEINQILNLFREESAIEDSDENPLLSSVPKPTLINVLRDSTTRQAVFIGCGLQLFQQLAGINTVMYYGAPILSMAGLSAGSQDKQLVVWLAAMVAALYFIFSLLGLLLVSRYPRRMLLVASMICVVLALLLLTAGFLVIDQHTTRTTVFEAIPTGQSSNPASCSNKGSCKLCTSAGECGFCYMIDRSTNEAINGSCLPALSYFAEYSTYGRCSRAAEPHLAKWAYDSCPTQFGWLVVLGLVVFLVAFAPGLNHLPWVINSELYPSWARGTGNSLAVATNWFSNLIISMTFIHLTKAIDTFMLYALLSALGTIFVIKFVPETSKVTLEEANMLFSKESAR